MNIIENAHAELEQWCFERKKDINSYRDAAAVVERALEQFPDMVERKTWVDGTPYNVDIGIWPGAIQGVRIRVKNVQNWMEVLPLLEFLEANGYPVKKSEDFPEIRRRTYYANPIAVMAFLDETSETCTVVETGVQPVYAFVCGDTKL